MSHTEPPQAFPRCELTADRHQQIRDLLIREATSVAGRSIAGRSMEPRRSRSRLGVPVAAFVVVLAITGSSIAVRALTGSGGPETTNTKPAPPSKTISPNSLDQQCVSSRGRVATDEAKDLLYLGPKPTGYSEPEYFLEGGFSCYMGSDPVASFYRLAPNTPSGTFDAAVTVSHLADAPEKIAAWPNMAWRHLEAVGGSGPKVVNVKIGGRPGKLTARGMLTWQAADGQYWSMKGSGLAKDRLISIATELKLSGSRASWSEATAQGFTRLDVPYVKPEKKLIGVYWNLVYRKKNCHPCSFSLDVFPSTQQDQHPWQAYLGTLRMPARLVTVDGRLGLLSELGTFQSPSSKTGHELRTLTADGANLWVGEETTGKRTDLVAWAQGLRKIGPGDPRIARMQPGF